MQQSNKTNTIILLSDTIICVDNKRLESIGSQIQCETQSGCSTIIKNQGARLSVVYEPWNNLSDNLIKRIKLKPTECVLPCYHKADISTVIAKKSGNNFGIGNLFHNDSILFGWFQYDFSEDIRRIYLYENHAESKKQIIAVCHSNCIDLFKISDYNYYEAIKRHKKRSDIIYKSSCNIYPKKINKINNVGMCVFLSDRILILRHGSIAMYVYTINTLVNIIESDYITDFRVKDNLIVYIEKNKMYVHSMKTNEKKIVDTEIKFIDSSDYIYCRLENDDELPKLFTVLPEIIVNSNCDGNNNSDCVNDSNSRNSNSNCDSSNSECCVCFDDILQQYAIIPCGHIDVCSNCLDKVNDECPTCRSKITSRLRIYK
jgi:hypothetical protein